MSVGRCNLLPHQIRFLLATKQRLYRNVSIVGTDNNTTGKERIVLQLRICISILLAAESLDQIKYSVKMPFIAQLK